jgi:hypothetical protein
MSGLPRLSGLVWIGVAAAAAMVVGSFGPWGKAIGLVNASISGTDGANDGWLVVVSAVVGGLAIVLYSQRQRTWALGTVLAGAAGTAVTVNDRGNVTDTANDNTSNLVDFQVGWGLNLALGASVVLGVVGLVALLGNQRAPGMASSSDPLPSSDGAESRPCPTCGHSMRRTASTCPHCGAGSTPWVLHEDVWWAQNDTGVWHWLDAETNTWKIFEDPASSGSPLADLTATSDNPPDVVTTDAKSDKAVGDGLPSTSAELERLADLHARSVLTDEEFRLAKARLLNQ